MQLCQDMAVKIVETILKNDTSVDSVERVNMLFDFIAPLAKDTEGVDTDPDDEVSHPFLPAALVCACAGMHLCCCICGSVAPSSIYDVIYAKYAKC